MNNLAVYNHYGHGHGICRDGRCGHGVGVAHACCNRTRRVHRFRPIELMTSDVTAEFLPEFRTEGLVLTVTGDVNRIAMYRTAVLVLGQPIKGDFDNLPVFLRIGDPNDLTVSVGVDDRHYRYGFDGSRFAFESLGEVDGQCEATVELVPACENPENLPAPCPPRKRGRLIPVELADNNVAFGRAIPNWRCKPLGVCLEFTNKGTVVML